MKIGYENRTCCVAGQVGIWKILVFGSKNQTQISEKLIFGPVKTGPKGGSGGCKRGVIILLIPKNLIF